MKLLKTIALTGLGVLALLVVVLILLGHRRDAGRNEAQVEIARPAAEVFPWLTEPAKLTRWIAGLEESTPLTGDILRVGSRSREVVVRGDERYEMETEITSLDPNGLLAVKIVSPGFDVGGRYDLTEQGGKTRLRYVGVARYKTTLARLMEPVITPAAQKQLEQNLETLRRLVEGAP